MVAFACVLPAGGGVAASFDQNSMSVGGSKTVTIQAHVAYNYTHIYLKAGQRYRFTVDSPAWNNGVKETDADGYNDTAPYASLRRHLEYKTMALVGEYHSADNSPNAYTGHKFLIGKGREFTANYSGYLVAFANDSMAGYLDNSRVVTLTVKRVQ